MARILNTSIAASWLVLAVIAVRFLLRRAPKAFHCALWALVAIRLLCPFSIESELSLVPSREFIPAEYLTYEPPRHDESVTLEPVTNPDYPPVTVETPTTVGRLQLQDLYATLIWWTGIGVLTIYAAYSYLSLRLRVRLAAWSKQNVWECDDIDSPFILGILRPRIYLPSDMDALTRVHVLAHENAHLRRLDHFWKPLGFALLTVHWFNPVMWLGYWLLCQDIELACDEMVIRSLGRMDICRYSESLIRCSIRRRHILACPLAFGEVGVKERVKTMLKYRKPGFWMMVVAIVAAVTLAGCFLTDPVSEEEPEEGFRPGIYQPEGLDALDPVCITLRADGTAWFNFNLSSTNGFCAYQLTDSTLTLTGSTGKWVFSVEDEGFRFLGDLSDGKEYLSNGQGLKDLPDDTLFVYAKPEALQEESGILPQETSPEATEDAPENIDPGALWDNYNIYQVESWSANWPIDTSNLIQNPDRRGVTYEIGTHRIWSHQNSTLWITGVRRQGKNIAITLDFTHDMGTLGEVVLPYSPTEALAPTVSRNQKTADCTGDTFTITLTQEEYQSGYVWVELENLYHVKYVTPSLNPQACPLIPGTEIYEARGDIYNLDTPSLILYPDGTGLYNTGFSMWEHPFTYTRTEDTLTVQTTSTKSYLQFEWVFAIVDGELRFQAEQSDKMEYWRSVSMCLTEDQDRFFHRDTIDALDIAIWNAIYRQNHKFGDIGAVGFRVLDVLEESNGLVTAQVCYQYCTLRYENQKVRGSTGYGLFCASITFDPAEGYRVVSYTDSYINDVRLTDTALDTYRRNHEKWMRTFGNECWLQAAAWIPSEEA